MSIGVQGLCAPSSKFSNSILSRALLSFFFFIERCEIRWWLGDCTSKTMGTNIEHNTSFRTHSGFRLCVDLLVYFVPFVRDANNRFCSNSIICSFAFSSTSHSMYYGIVFAVRSHRIFLFNLITNGNVYCATAASLIICNFRFYFHFQSNLYTNICHSYVNMTFKWSIGPDGLWYGLRTTEPILHTIVGPPNGA